MQQYKNLQKAFHLSKLPSIKTQKFGKIDNADILIGLIVVMAFLNLFGVCHSQTVLIFGFLAPLLAINYGVEISMSYFVVLSVFLWVRLSSTLFSTADGAFIVILWHPNFGQAEKLSNTFKEYVPSRSKSIFSRVSKKIDRFLD